MGKIKNFEYFFSRGGGSYCVLKKLREMGIVSSRYFMMSKANARFTRYFENLHEEDYEKELKAQFDSILGGWGIRLKENPETFNEKMQWLKAHDTTPLKTRLADKYLVREWVAETIGEQYLIPLVGGPWKSAGEINFDALPNRFVLKANHGSGMNLIVKDKSLLDVNKTEKTCDEWLHQLFGWYGMEAQYFKIPRRIIAEQYIENIDGDIYDYKFHCFDGRPEYIQYCKNRSSRVQGAFFDRNWELQEFTDSHLLKIDNMPSRPGQLSKAIEIAGKLSEGFSYVRVDLYLLGDEVIYFGEMTFSPMDGHIRWSPESADRMLGEKIIIA